MPDLNLRYEQVIASLKRRDYRLTPQRIALIRLIAASHEHPSAMQLHEQVRAQFPTTSLATIYKTLDLLKEMGEVLEISLHNDNHYDGNRLDPHPHLICTKCHKIVDGDLETPVHTLLNNMEHNFNFRILSHQLNIYGLCFDCQKSSQ
jgi:Fur family peroxide stress response transcriptional regulator